MNTIDALREIVNRAGLPTMAYAPEACGRLQPKLNPKQEELNAGDRSL
jgi:hypothetical protein